MVQKTNTTKKETKSLETDIAAVMQSTMGQDLKNSVLIVSLVVNLVVFSLWVALQLTTVYDSQLAGFLLGR